MLTQISPRHIDLLSLKIEHDQICDTISKMDRFFFMICAASLVTVLFLLDNPIGIAVLCLILWLHFHSLQKAKDALNVCLYQLVRDISYAESYQGMMITISDLEPSKKMEILTWLSDHNMQAYYCDIVDPYCGIFDLFVSFISDTDMGHFKLRWG